MSKSKNALALKSFYFLFFLLCIISHASTDWKQISRPFFIYHCLLVYYLSVCCLRRGLLWKFAAHVLCGLIKISILFNLSYVSILFQNASSQLNFRYLPCESLKNATPSLPETGYGGEIQIEKSSYRSRSHLLLATTFEEKMGKIDSFIDPRPYWKQRMRSHIFE